MKPFESECKYKWRSPCEKQAIPCCAALFMHTYHSTTIFYTDFAPLSPTDRLAFPKWQFSGAAAVAMSATELQEYRERNEQEKPQGNRFGPMSMTLGPTWIAYNCFCWNSFSSKLFSEFSDAGCCVFPPALCQIDLGLVWIGWSGVFLPKTALRIGFLLLLICVPGLCCWFCWIKVGRVVV